MGIFSEAHEEFDAQVRAHHAAVVAKLTEELELLRTIAHNYMGQVTSSGEPGPCADDAESRRGLAQLLNEWLEKFEQPRLEASRTKGKL